MAGGTIAKLSVDLIANSAKFTSELERSRKSVDSMRSSLGLIKLDAIINLGERAFRAAGQIYNLTYSLASLGSDLTRNARTLGMTVEEYQQWQYVAKACDVESEQLMLGIRVLTKNMGDLRSGTGEAKDALARIGITAKDSNKNINELLPEIIKRLSEIGNTAEQNQLAMEIFGSRSGLAIANMVREGKNIDEIIKRMKDLGLAIDEDVAQRLADSEQAFKDWSFTWIKLKTELVPLVELAATALTKLIKTIKDARDAWADLFGGKTVATQLEADIRLQEKLIGVNEDYLRQMKEKSPMAQRFAAGAIEDAEIELKKRKENLAYLKEQLKLEKEDRALEREKRKGVGGEPEDGSLSLEKRLTGMKKISDQYDKLFILEDKYNQEAIEGADYWDRYYSSSLTRMKEISTQWDVMFQSEDRYNEESIQGGARIQTMLQNQLKAMQEIDEQIDASQTARQDLLTSKMTKSADFMKEFSSDLSSDWTTNLTNMLKGSESFSDGIKNIFTSMADSVISSLSKILMNMGLFGSMKGEYSSGQGLLGGLGSLVKGIFSPSTTPAVGIPGGYSPLGYQHGTDYVPQTGLALLHKGERVVPADRNKGGGVIVNVINQAPNTKAETKESQDGRGNRSIDIIISELVGREIGRTGSAPNRAIKEMGGSDSLIRR